MEVIEDSGVWNKDWNKTNSFDSVEKKFKNNDGDLKSSDKTDLTNFLSSINFEDSKKNNVLCNSTSANAYNSKHNEHDLNSSDKMELTNFLSSVNFEDSKKNAVPCNPISAVSKINSFTVCPEYSSNFLNELCLNSNKLLNNAQSDFEINESTECSSSELSSVDSNISDWLSSIRIEDSVEVRKTNNNDLQVNSIGINFNITSSDSGFSSGSSPEQSNSVDSNLTGWLSSVKITDSFKCSESNDCTSLDDYLNTKGPCVNSNDEDSVEFSKCFTALESTLSESCSDISLSKSEVNSSEDEKKIQNSNLDKSSKFSFFDLSVKSFNEFSSILTVSNESSLSSTQILNKNKKGSEINLLNNIPISVLENSNNEDDYDTLPGIDLSACIKKLPVFYDNSCSAVNMDHSTVNKSSNNLHKPVNCNNNLPVLLVEESEISKRPNLKQSLFSRTLACKTKSDVEIMKVNSIKTGVLSGFFIRPVNNFYETKLKISYVEPMNQPLVTCSGRFSFNGLHQ